MSARRRLIFWSLMLRAAAVANNFYWWAYQRYSAASWVAHDEDLRSEGES